MNPSNEGALAAIIKYDVIMIDHATLGLTPTEMMEAVNNILEIHGLLSNVMQDRHGWLLYEENPYDVVTDAVLVDLIDYLTSLNLYNTEETLGYLNDTLRTFGSNLRLVVYAFPEDPIRYEFEVVVASAVPRGP